jgi:hypothetical protein
MKKQVFKSEKEAYDALIKLKEILGGRIIIDKSMKSSVLIMENSDNIKTKEKIGFYINNYDSNYEILPYIYTAD